MRGDFSMVLEGRPDLTIKRVYHKVFESVVLFIQGFYFYRGYILGHFSLSGNFVHFFFSRTVIHSSDLIFAT